MPSIKTDYNNYYNDNDNDQNDLDHESNVKFLKEVFTLDDFLECEKTKYLLIKNGNGILII